MMLAQVGCSSGGNSAANDTDTEDDTPGDMSGDPTADTPLSGNSINLTVMLNRINSERAANGAQALTWNSNLEAAALRHTNDMRDNNHFSHTGTDNSSVGSRVTATGYRWSTVGENIANGFSNEGSVMDAWMNSPGHRANLLNGSFRKVGVARVGNYWTQVFGTQRNRQNPQTLPQPASNN